MATCSSPSITHSASSQDISSAPWSRQGLKDTEKALRRLCGGDLCLRAGPCPSGLCTPHLQFPGSTRRCLGKCLLHKHSTEITVPLPGACPCPVLPHSSSLTQGGRAATPRWAPLAVLQRFTECPLLQAPQSSARIHAWVLGCLKLVPSGLGPNTSSRASSLGFLRLAPPSSG